MMLPVPATMVPPVGSAVGTGMGPGMGSGSAGAGTFGDGRTDTFCAGGASADAFGTGCAGAGCANAGSDARPRRPDNPRQALKLTSLTAH